MQGPHLILHRVKAVPIYSMINPDTGKQEEVLCTIADMEVLKQEGWVHVLTTGHIISGTSTSGQGGGKKTSDSWKDTLRKIRDAHPHSTIDV